MSTRHRIRRFKLFLMFVVLVLTVTSITWAGNPGETTAAFLKLGVGARPTGMGEAFVAVANDVNALYWNPAGLSQLKDKEISFGHTEWFQDIKYEYMGWINPVGKLGTLGISVIYLYLDGMERRSAPSINPEGTFGAHDLAVGLSFGKSVNSSLSIGASLKYINLTIDNEKGNSIVGDLGGLYKFPSLKNFTLGLQLQNMGPGVKFISKRNQLPFRCQIGLSYRYLEKITAALAVNKPIDNKASFRLGAEYWLREVLALRVGYKTETISELGTLSGLTAGIGFKVSGVIADYSFVPYGDLGNTHRISMSFRFGSNRQ